MDDESYFMFKNDGCPGNLGYYKSKDMDRGDVPDEVRLRTLDKFPMKLMAWVVISEKGIREPYFCPQNQSVNGEIYRKKCIQEHLVPFLDKHHADGNYYFWPDLASAHYAKDTIKVMELENIAFFPKACNPPNVPQLRPIEDFWASLKASVYENGWEAKSFRQLKQRICLKLTAVTPDMCHAMFCSVKTNLRIAAERGVEALIH